MKLRILKNQRETRAMKNITIHIVVFVCLATRAIHLEPVYDLSAEELCGAVG